MLVFYLKLREHSEGYVQEHEFSRFRLPDKIAECLSTISNPWTNILFVLDGYDELNDKTISILPDLIPPETYPNTKIIMTTRENYATTKDYDVCFGAKTYSLNYICPFNTEQRSEYISKFVKTVQGLKKYHLEFESLQTVDEYEQYFKQYQVLFELSQVPFTLRIIMNILPLLVQ